MNALRKGVRLHHFVWVCECARIYCSSSEDIVLFYLFFDESGQSKQTNNAVSNCLKSSSFKTPHFLLDFCFDRLYTTNAIVMNAPEQTPTSPPPTTTTTNSGSTDSIVLALKPTNDFSSLKGRFLSSAIRFGGLASSNGVQTSFESTDRGINILEKAVRDEVTRSYDVLMNQLTGIEDAEKILHTLNGVNSLHQTTAKVRTEIAEPHKLERENEATRTANDDHRCFAQSCTRGKADATLASVRRK